MAAEAVAEEDVQCRQCGVSRRVVRASQRPGVSSVYCLTVDRSGGVLQEWDRHRFVRGAEGLW